MKNIIVLIGIGMILAVVAVFIFGSGNVVTGNVIDSKGEFQVVKLSVENGKYIMAPSEIKKGIPVKIEADISNMPGCSKSIVIPSFNVRKSFSVSDNTLEFIPDKSGTFNIACSMNMYGGTFTVLEEDGSKSNYADKPLPSRANSGGCGCGG